MPKLKHAMMEAFCQHYVGDARGIGAKAARMAGYKHPEASARDNIRKPMVLERIEELRAELQANSEALTPEEIHREWARIIRDASIAPSDRLTALRDCARANRMFVTQIEAKHTIERPEKTMTLEELEAEAARLEVIASKGIEA